MESNDYMELYFKLYSDVSDIIDSLQELQKKYEELYCGMGSQE